MLVPAILVVAIAFAPALLLAPLFFWARRLARNASAPRWSLRVAAVFLALGAIQILATAAVCGYRVLTLSSTSYATDKARALAEGVSEAMNDAALAALLGLAALPFLVFASVRMRKR